MTQSESPTSPTSTAWAASPKLTSESNEKVSSTKLLDMMGRIDSNSPPNFDAMTATSGAPITSSSRITPASSCSSIMRVVQPARTSTRKVNCFTEPLKRAHPASCPAKRRKTCESNTSGESSSSPSIKQLTTNNDNKRRRKKKTLNFSETVQVVPIPMRDEYCSRVRSRIWSNAMELYENAARNTIEFASEGWDWRSVLEDECMYVCTATGELVHPCHYNNNNNNNNHASSDNHQLQQTATNQDR